MSTIVSTKKRHRTGLLSVGQAAMVLNVHPDTLRRWGAQGIVKTYRVGPRGDRRFYRTEIVRMLKSDGR